MITEHDEQRSWRALLLFSALFSVVRSHNIRRMRHAVILAGGSGTRLWPASRRERPKQFLPLGSKADESLLAATARRLESMCPTDRLLVVTAASQAALVRDALPSLADDAVLAEPAARNTAAAIGLAAVHLSHRDPDAIMAVLPSDHHIGDEAGFLRVVDHAFAVAEQRDMIATIGVVPTRPETGYGYLDVGEPLPDRLHDPGARSAPGSTADAPGCPVYEVERFIEKPCLARATEYFAADHYLWNAGMFFARSARWLDEIARHLPETARGLDEIHDALERGGPDQAAAVTERVYGTFPAVSIDRGVMERARDVVTLRGDFAWNDVGSWRSLGDYRPTDDQGNMVQGTVVTHDARDNIVVGDPGCAIAIVGVEGLVVVQSGDGILVIPRERAQDVRAAVAALQDRDLERFL